jgi:hypothetical protein
MDKLKQILYGIDKYSNKNKILLSKIGEHKITDIYVYRKPIQKILKILSNLASLFIIEQNLKRKNYDDIFHLFIILKCDDGKHIIIEKNEIINIVLIDINFLNTFKNIEKIKIDYNENSLSINELLNNTLKKIGEYNYFNYDSRNLNCQKYILDILLSNNLLKSDYKTFIYQNPTEIYKNTGLLGSISKGLTNIASSFRIIKGDGLKKSYINKINSDEINNYKLKNIIFNKKFFNNNKDDIKKYMEINNLKYDDYIIKNNKIIFYYNTNIETLNNNYIIKDYNKLISIYYFKSKL